MATLPGAWRDRVSAGTDRPGVSILWLGEIESLICSFYLVWQHVKLSVQIRPWDTLACCWDDKQPTNPDIHCHLPRRKATKTQTSNCSNYLALKPITSSSHREDTKLLQERFVCWLLNVPATCECISGTDLLRQVYVLPHWDRSCRSNVLPHPVTVYWHQADQSQC